MNTQNTQLIAVTTPAVTALATIERFSKKGNFLGSRVLFVGDGRTAADIKQGLKEDGLKGKALKGAVNAALSGRVAEVAWMRHDALSSSLRSGGFIPNFSDSNSKGTTALTRYVKVASSATSVREENSSLKLRIKALEALLIK